MQYVVVNYSCVGSEHYGSIILLVHVPMTSEIAKQIAMLHAPDDSVALVGTFDDKMEAFLWSDDWIAYCEGSHGEN